MWNVLSRLYLHVFISWHFYKICSLLNYDFWSSFSLTSLKRNPPSCPHLTDLMRPFWYTSSVFANRKCFSCSVIIISCSNCHQWLDQVAADCLEVVTRCFVNCQAVFFCICFSHLHPSIVQFSFYTLSIPFGNTSPI